MRTKNPMAKKPQQILFSKNTYGPKTKVENWDYSIHAEKKDNYVYRDELSNHISTYGRWGTEDQGVGMTETHHMLSQVFTKTDPVYSFKPLVNFTSYPCTDLKTISGLTTKCYNMNLYDSMKTNALTVNLCLGGSHCFRITPGRNKLMKNADLAQLSADFGVMDYLTTQQDDYRNPYPCVMKPLTMSSPPWLMNRVIRSDLTHNHGTAPPRGDYQCLDTHTPIGHIRQMRLYRYQSFDPATCLQDFPTLNKPLDINETN